MVHTVSCDEKPGIQAIVTTGADLRPTTETGCVYRDAEYKRLGTLSLLAGIDLLTGIAIELVSRILGHASTQTTRIYAKPSLEMIRQAMDRSNPELNAEQQLFFTGFSNIP